MSAIEHDSKSSPHKKVVDIKDDVRIREHLDDGIPDLTAVVGCHQDWDFNPELLAALADALE